MNGTTVLEAPAACTEGERQEFARLVRQGFAGSGEGLGGRIRGAERLAFHYAPEATLAAIAALKAPGRRYRDQVFEKAAVVATPADYELELGWVFVHPAWRGQGIAGDLCRRLLEAVPDSGVFATTRPDNRPMIGILVALDFVRVGGPFSHHRRDEVLVLYLRSPSR